MPEQITDCKITKVYAGPTGESEHGPWEMWNFYVNNGSDKFTWFGGGKKITPVVGMQIAYMEYEKEAKGKFTNLNVKKLVLKEESTPEAIPNAKEDQGPIPQVKNDREVSFYVAYAKDIAVEMIQEDNTLPDNFEAVCSRVARAGVKLMNESLNSGQISSQDSIKGSPVNDQETEQAIHPEQDNGDYSGRIDCPNLLDNEGNPKNILKRACQTCSQREGCPALG